MPTKAPPNPRKLAFLRLIGGAPSHAAAEVPAATTDAETKRILVDYERKAAALAVLLQQSGTIRAPGSVDGEDMKLRLSDAVAGIKYTGDEGVARRAALSGALLGSVRYKDSLRILDKLATRVAADVRAVDKAYNALVVFSKGAAAFPKAMEAEREKRELQDVVTLLDKLDDPKFASKREEIERGLEVARARTRVRGEAHSALAGMDMHGSNYTPGKQLSVHANFAEGMSASVSKVNYANGETTIVKIVSDDVPVAYGEAERVNLPTESHKAANLMGRAVGTSRIAELLGLSIVPKTEPGVFMDQPAVVQKFVPGNASAKEKTLTYSEIQEMAESRQSANEIIDVQTRSICGEIVSGGPIDPNKVGGDAATLTKLCRFAQSLKQGDDPENPILLAAVAKQVKAKKIWTVVRLVVEAAGVDVAAPTIQRSFADAHLLDLITGQFDRNPGNFIFTEESGEPSANLIDNDMCLTDGIEDLSDAGLAKLARKCRTVLPAMPHLVNAATAERILGVNAEALLASLAGTNLKPSELAAAVKRLDAVKAHLIKIKDGVAPGPRWVTTWNEQTLNEQLGSNNNYVSQQRDALAAQVHEAPLRFPILVKDLRENGAKLCLSLVKGKSPKLQEIYTLTTDQAYKLFEIDSKNGNRMAIAFEQHAPHVLSVLKEAAIQPGMSTLALANLAIVAHRDAILRLELAVTVASGRAQQLPVNIMLGRRAAPPVASKVHVATIKTLGTELKALEKQLSGLRRAADDIRARSGPFEGRAACIRLPNSFDAGVALLDRDHMACGMDLDRVQESIDAGQQSLVGAVAALKNTLQDVALWTTACSLLLERVRAAEDAAGAMERSGSATLGHAVEELEAAERARVSGDEPKVQAALTVWDGYAGTLRRVGQGLTEAVKAGSIFQQDFDAIKRSSPGGPDADTLLDRVSNKRLLLLDQSDGLRKALAKFGLFEVRALRLRDPAAADERLRAEKAIVVEINGLEMLRAHLVRNPKLIADIRAFQASPTEDTYWAHFLGDSNARGYVTGVSQLDQIFPKYAPTILASVYTGNATRRFSEPLNHYGAGKDRTSFREDHAATRAMSPADAFAWHATYLGSKIPEIEAFDAIARRLLAALA
jgi:hypothetical protein